MELFCGSYWLDYRTPSYLEARPHEPVQCTRETIIHFRITVPLMETEADVRHLLFPDVERNIHTNEGIDNEIIYIM